MKFLYVIIVIFFFAVIIGNRNRMAEEERSKQPAQKPAEQPAPIPARPKLLVHVGCTGDAFAVVNLNEFDLLNVEVRLNSGMIERGFTWGTAKIKRRGMATVSASSFQKRNGVRFNPFSDEPERAVIVCQNQAGQEFFEVVEVEAIR